MFVRSVVLSCMAVKVQYSDTECDNDGGRETRNKEVRTVLTKQYLNGVIFHRYRSPSSLPYCIVEPDACSSGVQMISAVQFGLE